MVHATRLDPTHTQRGVPGGGGGSTQGRVPASQILCEIFVRDLFGVFADLRGYTLGSAFAHLYRARGFG